MTDPHTSTYVSNRRPSSHELFDRWPDDVLNPEELKNLRASLRTHLDVVELASAGRMWEELLESHRIPFLLVRVADLRNSQYSSATALELYKETQRLLKDGIPEFDLWVQELEQKVLLDAAETRATWTRSTSLPSQHWKSTQHVALPYCRIRKQELEDLRERWINMKATSTTLLKRFMNLHCVETNLIEGTFLLNASATTQLVNLGFFNQQLDPSAVITSGQVEDCPSIINILQDTHKALDEIFPLTQSSPFHISRAKICDIHRILMKSCRLLPIKTANRLPRLVYINIGTTRQETFSNVVVLGAGLRIQFCPYQDVNKELDRICDQMNYALTQNIDPFALSAWISDIFISLHPFEDGNGRMSRILASIPLLKAGLPPLCIPLNSKAEYNLHLNAVRGLHNGDYEHLMKVLFKATKLSLESLPG